MSPGGGLTEKIECILFDIYGTLFISAAGDISLADNASPRITKIAALLKKFEINIKNPKRTGMEKYNLSLLIFMKLLHI